MHFWLEFDVQTRLPVRAKVWPGKMQGTPAFDFQRIVFDELIPDERFQYNLPQGATIVEAGDGPALLEQARKLVEEGRFSEAISLCEEVMTKYPKWWGGIECRMLIGCCRLSLGSSAEAIAVLEPFPKDDGYVGDSAAYYLGVACERVGRLEDALRAYIRASQRVSDCGRTGMFPDPEAREGIVRLQDRMFGDAIPDWADVVDVKTDRERLGLWYKADDLRQAGRFQQALDVYREAIALWPQHYHRARCIGPLMLGLCYEGLGQAQQASDQFRKCIEHGNVMDSPDRWAVRQAKEHLARLPQGPASQRTTGH
jgi:tetratricopeptide (TPR) repeat protein